MAFQVTLEEEVPLTGRQTSLNFMTVPTARRSIRCLALLAEPSPGCKFQDAS